MGKNRRFRRHPPGRRERKKPRQPRESTPSYVDLGPFGRVPLVKVRITDAEGNEHEILDYDPDHEPPLPRGAVRGDVRKQDECRLCHSPRYFYVDEPKTCVQCGEAFVFGAAEQKYWYETLRFRFDSVAIRCIDCRGRRRSVRALQAQLSRARERARAAPNDPAGLLELAEALVRYHQRTGEGDLNDAVAAARRARTLWPEAAEALFWEGIAQARSGRPAKARSALSRFVRRARITRRTRPLLDIAASKLP